MAGQVDRRRFLGIAGATGAGLGSVLAGVSTAPVAANPRLRGYPFTLGVASGDPLPGGVVLWTKLAPEPLAEDGSGGMPPRSVPVQWEVAEDEGFRRVVRRGTVHATPELGHSVHAEVDGLLPRRDYFYRFRAGSEISPAGHTRTAPEAGSSPSALTFALASCQAWAGGRFASYRTMAEEDLDLVVHVGDYVYEGGDHETLTDFRLNHARYKTSVDLQAATRRSPSSSPSTTTRWRTTGRATSPRTTGRPPTTKSVSWRCGRQRSRPTTSTCRCVAAPFPPVRTCASTAGWPSATSPRWTCSTPGSTATTRSTTSSPAARWIPVLSTRRAPSPATPSRPGCSTTSPALARGGTSWAQQTIMAHYDYDPGGQISVNHDQWDGYAGSRRRFLDFVGKQRPSNPVVLTGDWHSSWVNDVTIDPYDASSEVLATEFVGPSISSGCGWADEVAAALPANPQVKFFDGTHRGYLRCTLTPESWRSDYRVVTSAADTTNPATTLTSWVVGNGRPGAQPA